MFQLFQFWPFLRQSTPHAPYRGPWPREGINPLRPEAWFTNPDARLRPREGWILRQRPNFAGDNDTVEVTPANFPQLSALFWSLAQHSGTGVNRLVIREHYARKGYISEDSRTVGISLDQLNVNDFNSIRFLLGHEIGHAWQQQNLNRRTFPLHEPRITDGQRYESEVDIFARCLSGDAASIIRGIRNMGATISGKTYASSPLRESAVRLAQPQDCDFFNLVPTFPAWLYRQLPHR